MADNIEEGDNQDKIIDLAQRNPVLAAILNRIALGEITYGEALELSVIALAEQVQSIQNNYRRTH